MSKIPADARWDDDDDVLTFEPHRKPPAEPRERPAHRELHKSRAGVRRHA